MNRFSRFRNPALVAIGAALGALAVIGFSVVSATGADAQIHACLKTSNGSLSILAAGDICPKGSTSSIGTSRDRKANLGRKDQRDRPGRHLPRSSR